MKKLLLLATMLLGINVASAQTESYTFQDSYAPYSFSEGDDTNEITSKYGPGEWQDSKVNETKGRMFFKIKDHIGYGDDRKEFKGHAVFHFKTMKTWYNEDYDGLWSIDFDWKFDTIENDSDRGWGWNWSYYNKIRNGLENNGFTIISKSEGSTNKHFVILKKDKVKAHLKLTVIQKNTDYDGNRTYDMEQTLRYTFEKH